MMTIRYTIKWTYEIEKAIEHFWHGYTKSIVLESVELGRVLLLHTDSQGDFQGYTTMEVIQLFELQNINCIFTCYPNQQYHKRPEIAEKLHIQFPECDTTICHAYEVDDVDNVCMLSACTTSVEGYSERTRQKAIIKNKRMEGV